MAKYKAYPEYKDSGVEWLGCVPTGWLITELKRYSWVKGGYAFSSDSFTSFGEPVIRIGDISKDGSINLENCKYVSHTLAKQSRSYTVRNGELLMAMTGATIGKAGFYECEFPALINQRVGLFKVLDNLMHYRFLWYTLKSYGYQEYIKLTAFGGAQPNISDVGMVGYRTTVPSLQEQSRITSFLDHETAKIDNLIDKQKQLIELLKEKRQAVISHAVTKGLNPDVPMKDSGVEWLGPISQHCIITKLKYLTVLKTEKTVSNNIRYVGMENISSGTGKFLSKDEMTPEGNSVSFECNDVLFGKLRPYLAKSWLATFSGICSSEFLVLQPKKIHSRYLNYYLLTNEFIKQVDSSTYGSKMPRANWDFISQLPVPTWTYKESKAIAVYLDNLTAKLDCLLEKQNQQVNLLQERRTALISAAVTGKIDVRDWVAPDTQDVEEPQEVTA